MLIRKLRVFVVDKVTIFAPICKQKNAITIFLLLSEESLMAGVQKVSIDAGFTCPNKDGSKGTGGCTYCNNNTFNPDYCKPIKPIKQQIDEGIEFFSKKYKTQKYLAYFQAFTNTYAPLADLKKMYEDALDMRM